MTDAKRPAEARPGAEALEAADDRLAGVADPLLEALDGDVARLDDLSAQLFGAAPERAFESAALEHARTAEEEGVAGRGELEELVRLSFRRSRGETTPAEEERLDALEHALGQAPPGLLDPAGAGGGEPADE